MIYALAFLSGIAFSAFLLWIWSLCRASADADRVEQFLRLYEQTEHAKDDPC